MNGWRLTDTTGEADDLIISVATGELDEGAAIAQHLQAHIEEVARLDRQHQFAQKPIRSGTGRPSEEAT